MQLRGIGKLGRYRWYDAEADALEEKEAEDAKRAAKEAKVCVAPIRSFLCTFFFLLKNAIVLQKAPAEDEKKVRNAAVIRPLFGLCFHYVFKEDGEKKEGGDGDGEATTDGEKEKEGDSTEGESAGAAGEKSEEEAATQSKPKLRKRKAASADGGKSKAKKKKKSQNKSEHGNCNCNAVTSKHCCE